jgi:hypothetical protein
MGTYIKMEQILATLETLADKEKLTAIKESKKQVAKENTSSARLMTWKKF